MRKSTKNKKQDRLTVDEAMRRLDQKKDCMLLLSGRIVLVLSNTIYKGGEKVENPKKKHDLGNGSWAAIDRLKHAGWRVRYESNFK